MDNCKPVSLFQGSLAIGGNGQLPQAEGNFLVNGSGLITLQEDNVARAIATVIPAQGYYLAILAFQSIAVSVVGGLSSGNWAMYPAGDNQFAFFADTANTPGDSGVILPSTQFVSPPYSPPFPFPVPYGYKAVCVVSGFAASNPTPIGWFIYGVQLKDYHRTDKRGAIVF